VSKKRALFLQIITLVILLAGSSLFGCSGITTEPPLTTTTAATTEISTTRLYRIQFIENGGSDVADIIGMLGAEATEPEDPIREDYIFVGWFSDIELTTAYVFSVIPDDNIEVYAKWEAEASVTDMQEALEVVLITFSLDATLVSISDMNQVYADYCLMIDETTDDAGFQIIQAQYLVALNSVYIKDYTKIDFEYAKSTATTQMESSLEMLQMFVDYGLLDDFAVSEVIEEYIDLIDNATTIEEVDGYLEAFRPALTAAIVFESSPPIELIIGFRAAMIAHIESVWAVINATGEDIGVIVVDSTTISLMELSINMSSDIPDIVEYVFYGIRQSFQSLAESSREYYTIQVTSAYGNVLNTLSIDMQALLTTKYQVAIEMIDTLQFYEDIAMAASDFMDFVELISP